MKVFIFFILIQCYTPAITGQEATRAPSRHLTTIKFTQYTGGVIVFKAQLDDFTDSLTFILDSGSGGISLDSTTVASLGLRPTAPERIIRGIGGMRKVGLVKNRRLTINNLMVDSLTFHVIDYDALSSLYGEKIDGIVGYSVLSRYIIKINYEKHEMSFWSNGAIKYPKGGYIMQPRISMLPILPSVIKDERVVKFKYLFDIGAGLTALFSNNFIEDSAFLRTKRKKYLKQGEGLGGKVDMYITVTKELKIGPYKFKNVPINIFDDPYNVTAYPQLGGLIGNDIFRRFNCILNYNARQIHITPNKFYREAFDYAYSGIELYLVDGKVVTGDIPENSPAGMAGFKAGDEVLAVNNKFGMNLNELKQAMQSTLGNVTVVVKRHEELLILSMKVIDIRNGKTSNSLMTKTMDHIPFIRYRNDVDTSIK